jgi:hypothetical protein
MRYWDAIDISEVFPYDGVYEVFDVSLSYNSGNTWEIYSTELTLAKALSAIKKQDDVVRRRWVRDMEREWDREHPTNPQKVQLFQIKITPKTTDKYFAKAVEEAKGHRARLADPTVPKKPKFKKADAPVPVFKVEKIRITIQRTLADERVDNNGAAPRIEE